MPKELPNPVAEDDVLRILALIASPPNLRDSPQDGDIKGQFDHWFDGGALRVITGWNDYTFHDGTRATRAVSLMLNVEIRFPDGREVAIRQMS